MRKILTLLLAISLATAGKALNLPQIFSDNMMLQQQTNAKIWGWAKPGSSVLVRTSWSNLKQNVVAGKDGRWEASVHTPKASQKTYTLTIEGDGEKKVLKNILVGEVWFCSGQSNMEMPLGGFWNCPVEGANEAIATSGKYKASIRVATVEKDGAQEPQKDVRCRWDECTPEKASAFSACGYFFARTLTDLLDVPVGIINCSWGGSCVEGWLPKEILLTYPDGLTPMDDTDYHAKMVMFNGMLAPLAGYTIKGFLWNQGESNVGKEAEYIDRFQTMTNLWRKMWGNDELPMYTVELPPYWYDNNEGDNGALLREAQHIIARQLKNSGCVCTTDLSYPWEEKQIHPTQKRQIGERLAYMAATRDYGYKGLASEAPEYDHMVVTEATQDDQNVIAGSKVSESVTSGQVLKIYFTNSTDGFDRMDNIQGFEAAGEDGVFHKAIVWSSSEWQNVPNPGCFLKLACPEVKDIKEIRYCFKNYAPGTLHNSRGLPVVPFRAKR